MVVRFIYLGIYVTILPMMLPSCAEWNKEIPRTSNISAEAMIYAQNGAEVESFIVNGTMAINYIGGNKKGPPFDYVELLGGKFGYYATSRGPILREDQVNVVSELLFDRKHYTDSHLACIFTPQYALRYSSSGKRMVVFLGTGCRMINMVDENGNIVEHGTIRTKSARRLSDFLESL